MVASGPSVPVVTGVPVQATTELSYAAFPFVARAADGTFVMSYRPGSSHWYGWFAIRESDDGVTWSDPVVPPGMTPLQTKTSSPAGGYVWGSAGIAAETAAQGGRTYIGVRRLHFVPGSTTVDGLRSYLIVRAADGTLSSMTALPTVVGSAIGFDASGMVVTADGTLLIAGYVSNRAWFFRSTDQGATWTATGDVAPATMGCGEPTLVQLPDGRLVAFLRSDGGANGEYDRLWWTIRGPDLTTGSWSVPQVAVINGSGMPTAAVVGDQVVLPYRGFSDTSPLPAEGRPARLAVFTVDSAGLDKVRDNIEVLPGSLRRFLYGTPYNTDSGWRVMWSEEGPKDLAGGQAFIYSAPFEMRPTP